MLVAEQPLGGEQGGVLGEVLAVHDQVLPVHVDLDVVDPLRGASVWITCSVMPMLRIRIFIAGSEFLCSRKTVTPWSRGVLRRLADAVDEARPRRRVRGLEGVVVALDPGPDDEVRPDLGGEVDRLAGQPQRLGAGRVVGRGEAALARSGGRGAGRLQTQ